MGSSRDIYDCITYFSSIVDLPSFRLVQGLSSPFGDSLGPKSTREERARVPARLVYTWLHLPSSPAQQVHDQPILFILTTCTGTFFSSYPSSSTSSSSFLLRSPPLAGAVIGNSARLGTRHGHPQPQRQQRLDQRHSQLLISSRIKATTTSSSTPTRRLSTRSVWSNHSIRRRKER